MWEYFADVLRVVDGDTVDVRVDLGFNVHFKVRVRLHGLNAPESRTRNKEEKIRGLAAKERLEELCKDGRIVVKSHGVGKFGRCLGELKTLSGRNINKTLISEGHAVEYHGGKR
jgi:micrococcal nuclease|tara:strand:+ start:268 stop:609 length:342 start_codon:yes stop_codon:yes gene_type:complete